MEAITSDLQQLHNSSNGFATNSTLSTTDVTTGFTFPSPPYSPLGTGLLAAMAGITSLCTTTGNILVVFSFIVERNLRQPSNYLLASLAVTDILIGLFSMPLYSLYLLKKGWVLGQTLCDLWLSLDFTVCLVSQYTVFLITLDRFCSVKAPAKYRNWRTKRKIKIMIAATWVIPAFIFFTSVMGWRTFTGSEPPRDYSCEVEFQSNALFTVILVISYYWVTLIVMVGLYIAIYKVAVSLHAKSKAKRVRMSNIKHGVSGGNNNNGEMAVASQLTTFTVATTNGNVEKTQYEGKAGELREEASDSSNDACSSDSASSRKCDNYRPGLEIAANAEQTRQTVNVSDSPLWKPRNSLESESIYWQVFDKHNPSSSSLEGTEANQLLANVDRQGVPLHDSATEAKFTIENERNSKTDFTARIRKFWSQLSKGNWGRGDPKVNTHRKKSKIENRARKALRTISFILGAFVLCWTPYHVVVLINPYCNGCVNEKFYDFSYWLCYMNSPLNPFCYALSNKQFKKTFIKIVKGEYFGRRRSRAHFARC